ncbi:hypothetical protein NBRC116495_32980 [Aurantivibrio plasticivorans]
MPLKTSLISNAGCVPGVTIHETLGKNSQFLQLYVLYTVLGFAVYAVGKLMQHPVTIINQK